MVAVTFISRISLKKDGLSFVHLNWAEKRCDRSDETFGFASEKWHCVQYFLVNYERELLLQLCEKRAQIIPSLRLDEDAEAILSKNFGYPETAYCFEVI